MYLVELFDSLTVTTTLSIPDLKFPLKNANKIRRICEKIDDSLLLFLSYFSKLANFNMIFNHHNPPFCIIIQPKWMCERNKTCTNNASSSSSSLSQVIVTIPHPPLPSSLLSYTSLLSLYLDWKPGPRCKGDSTLQLWCRAWSV